MCSAEEITIEEAAGQVEAERAEVRKNTGEAKGGVANDGHLKPVNSLKLRRLRCSSGKHLLVLVSIVGHIQITWERWND